MEQKLEIAIYVIDVVCNKILQKLEYSEEMQKCIHAVNDVCPILLQGEFKVHNILQILQDMMYGMTQKDEVFLLDVLRFGLKPELENIYNKLENKKPEGIYE